MAENISLANFNDNLAKKYAHLIPQRSLTKPLITARILEKVAFMSETPMEENGEIPPPHGDQADKEDHEFYLRKEPSQIKKIFLGYKEDPKMLPYKNPALAGLGLSSLFYGLQKANNATFGPRAVGEFDSFLLRRPWLIPLLIGAGTYVALKKQKDFHKYSAFVEPNVLSRYLIAVPASYLYAGVQETKIRKGQPIGEIQNLVRKHPFLMSVAGGWGLGKIQKNLLKLSSRRETLNKVISTLSFDKLDKLYNDTIQI